MGRMGKPNEVAPAYLFLASDNASYITLQVIHVNAGKLLMAKIQASSKAPIFWGYHNKILIGLIDRF